jgi:putative endonuclease
MGFEMKQVGGHVYILANRMGGTLYIGVTSDLAGRIFQHKAGMVEGFTKTYKVNRLVYFETHASIDAAILRENR